MDATQHIDAINERIEEAALDSGLSEDEVWHDVAYNYIQCDLNGQPAMQREVRRMIGIMAADTEDERGF